MMPKHRSTLKIHSRRGPIMVSIQWRNPAHMGHSVPPAQVNTLLLFLRRVFLIPCGAGNLRAIVEVQVHAEGWSRAKVFEDCGWRALCFWRRSEWNVLRWTCRERRVPPPPSPSPLECRRFYVPGLMDCCCWFVKFFPFLRRWKSRAGNTSLYPRPFGFTRVHESILQAWNTCFGRNDCKREACGTNPFLFMVKVALDPLHNPATERCLIFHQLGCRGRAVRDDISYISLRVFLDTT